MRAAHRCKPSSRGIQRLWLVALKLPHPLRLLLLFAAGGFVAFRASTAVAAFLAGFGIVWSAAS